MNSYEEYELQTQRFWGKVAVAITLIVCLTITVPAIVVSQANNAKSRERVEMCGNSSDVFRCLEVIEG